MAHVASHPRRNIPSKVRRRSRRHGRTRKKYTAVRPPTTMMTSQLRAATRCQVGTSVGPVGEDFTCPEAIQCAQAYAVTANQKAPTAAQTFTAGVFLPSTGAAGAGANFTAVRVAIVSSSVGARVDLSQRFGPRHP